MIVVSDTSPIHYLISIDQIEVLPRLFGRVLCPPEVIAECLHENAPPLVREWANKLPEWMEVCGADTWEHPQLDRLDAGEAAAIRLARGRSADILLMDERKGRQVATRLGLPVAGVISVLADAALQGMLDFDQAIKDLVSKTNFRISQQVLQMVKNRLQKGLD